MTKKLIIHIGTHKTGTTSIQSFLYKQRNFLQKNGVFYSSLVSSNINAGHHFVCQAINHNQITLKNQTKNSPKVKKLLNQINSSECKVAIISSELFSILCPELVKETFAEFDCHIICILRRQDDFVESMYRELKKSSYLSGNENDFIEHLAKEQELLFFSDGSRNLKGILPFYYDCFLDKWKQVFGFDKISVYPYDDPIGNGDSLQVFLNAVGLAQLQFPNIDIQKINSSFQSEIIQIRDVIDRQLSFDAKLLLRPSFWWANKHFMSSKKTYFFDTEKRTRIMSMVSESNARLARTYFKNFDVSWLVSKNTINEKPANSELNLNVSLQGMSLLIAHQAKQISQLKDEIAEIRRLLKK